MYKINCMKENNWRSECLYFFSRQEVSDGIQTNIFLKYELQTSIENNISCKKAKGKIFWLNGDGLKKVLTMNPVEEHITKRSTISENITYLVDKKIAVSTLKIAPMNR